MAAGAWAEQFQELGKQLAGWRDNASNVARSTTTDALADYLVRGDQLFQRLRSVSAEAVSGMERWPADLQKKLEILAKWLTARQGASAANEELTSAQTVLEESQAKLQACVAHGQMLRAHDQSLQSVSQLISTWSEEFDSECPTCGTDVEDRGGIRAIVADRLRRLEAQLAEARTDYERLRSLVERASSRLAELGAATPPLSYEEQSEIASAISWLGFGPMTDVLTDEKRFAALRAFMDHLRRMPRAEAELNAPEAIVQDFEALRVKVIAQYDRVASMPEAWKAVRDKLLTILATVTAEHLPSTLQALWNELAQSMMPAPWQYPGTLGFKVVSARPGARVTVVIQNQSSDALAAHLLNGAEVHNVGLAWFLTRYIVAGRFQLRALVFDDPAQSMDQPTYREFCRLLESLLRLHRGRGLPVSLVLLLHNDARAVDATRATNGTLQLLRWNYRTPVSLTHRRLYGESSAPAKPVASLRAVSRRLAG